MDLETPERLGRLEQRMDRVEEGVANFRDFQVDARDFFSRADERADSLRQFQDQRDAEIKSAIERRERRDAGRWNAAIVLISFLALCIAWLTYRDSRRAKNDAPSATSAVQSPQDAHNPYMPPR